MILSRRIVLALGGALLVLAAIAHAGLISVSGSRAVAASGGGSTTAIGTFISGMSSGTWSTADFVGAGSGNHFAMPTLTQSLIQGGGGTGALYEYATTGEWDPIHKLIVYAGNVHGGANVAGAFKYDAAANAWSALPKPRADGNLTHSAQQVALNPLTGDLFIRNHWQVKLPRVLPYTTQTWVDIPNDPVNNNVHLTIPTYIWNPSANSGAGELVSIGGEGVARYRYTVGSPASGTWSILVTSPDPAGLMGDGVDSYPWTGFYDPVSGDTFGFVRGDTTHAARVTSAGVVSTVSVTLPLDAGVLSDDDDNCTPVNGYVTPGAVTRRPLFICATGGITASMYEFHSETLSFTNLNKTPPSVNSYGLYVPVSEYDAIFFVTYINPSSYWYKR